MSAHEFSEWVRAWDEAPVDEDGYSPIADLAWRGMQSSVRKAEAEEDAPREQIGSGIAWAGFWIGLAAVICAAIWRLP